MTDAYVQLIKPTEQQLEWAEAELGVLIHYDIQVFEPSYEWRGQWGYHPEASIFNPEQLDTDQWLRTAQAAGASYAILVAKHCSGFSLWPTEAHDYSVKSTPWRNGEGDIVGDFIESCHRYGIRPGLYYSTSANGYFQVDNPGVVKPYDEEAQTRYNDAVIQQVSELWTNYGELFEIWFDGGTLPPEQGGPDVRSKLLELQPQAVCFQGPKEMPSLVRWIGNEDGVAPNPCWSTTDIISNTVNTELGAEEEIGECPQYGAGNPDGSVWAPAEADMPNRKPNQWFWMEGEDHLLYPVEELIECYYNSVGSNTNLLIGMVIDNRGRVPDADVKQFTSLGQELSRRFATPQAETSGEGDVVELVLQEPTAINHIVMMEEIAEGERIRSYRLEVLVHGDWQLIARGQSIGHKRIVRMDTMEASLVRITIDKAVATPLIRKLAAFYVAN